MITARDFEYMSMNQQEECLSGKGNFIISRIYNDHCIDLYSLNDFYVEVWYVNFHDALDNNFNSTKLSLLTDIVPITREEDINRYIELYRETALQGGHQ